ncbi:MAG: hypothetical protein J6S75_09080, partial [Thermoguttaceae bacterium]|nr:hypothetical protein [Thermoguttaceae bacterium]
MPETKPMTMPQTAHEQKSRDRALWWEVLAIFALFVLYGAYPVPDVNEQYYIGKAIHFWNADY